MLRACPGAISCRFPGRRRARPHHCGRWTCRSIDHRGPEFAKLGKRVLEGIKTIFKTTQPVIIYTATGTGAWEAALVNTLSPGDRVLMVETGQFATLWKIMAERLGLEAGIHQHRLARRRRSRKSSRSICARTRRTRSRRSACCTTRPRPAACRRSMQIRKAIDAAGHPALFLVDTISSLASTDYRHDEWGVDVTVGGAQKGLMLPPGMSFNAVSEKALRASKTASCRESFFQWDDMLTMYKQGFFPYTPATQMLYGLDYGDRDAARGRPRQRVRPPSPARRGDPPRRARLGARDPLPRSEILFADDHRRAAA